MPNTRVAGKNPARLTSRIRAPLKKGEVRRHEAVPEDDPARLRLVSVVSLKMTDPKQWAVECSRFVAENVGLAITYARNLNASHVPQEDLIHAAVTGLLEAIRRFELTKAGRFSTFAVWRMRYECDRLLYEKEGSIVKIPGQLRDDYRAVDEMARRLAQVIGVAPDDAQLLEALRADEQERTKVEQEKNPEDAKTYNRWKNADSAKVREIRESYVGAAYGQVDARLPETHKLSIELVAAMRQAMTFLTPKLRAIVADEYDIEGFDMGPLPSCVTSRQIGLELALRILRRRLET